MTSYYPSVPRAKPASAPAAAAPSTAAAAAPVAAAAGVPAAAGAPAAVVASAAAARDDAGSTNGSSAKSSFYAKGKASAQLARASTRSSQRAAPSGAPPWQLAGTDEQQDQATALVPGASVTITPKRPPRSEQCRVLDKDLAAATTPNAVLSIAQKDGSAMDGPNWANLVYAMAHFKKHGGGGSSEPPSRFGEAAERGERGGLAAQLRREPGWAQACRSLRRVLGELTARDTANVLWSLSTLDLRAEPLFPEAADSLSSKLSVIDPVSVSKAAWALTGEPNRERRQELFDSLGIPVVLRAEAFPIGALTMTAYSFAKAAHYDANVYEAVSSALVRHEDKDLRPIDVCNVIWAFCTVGYRDDCLFDRLCEEHLCKPEVLEQYNPQDLTNTSWGLSKVAYRHEPAMHALAVETLRQRGRFQAVHFTNLFYSFAGLQLRGPQGFLEEMAEAASKKIHSFDSANLSVVVQAMAQLDLRDARFLDQALQAILRPEALRSLSSRTLSMLFLAFFRLGRVRDADAIVRAVTGGGCQIGASGFSALVMTAEQGPDAARELFVVKTMADEAKDDRMRAAILNGAAIRMMKRGCREEGLRLLQEMQQQRCWSAVSSRLMSRVAAPGDAGLGLDSEGLWAKPVVSGIHPIAATRANEGPHAYTREFMSLQAALAAGQQGDVDGCMQAIEQFAESRSMWLKITAWEKAVVVHEVAKLRKPKLVLEIGAYIGYSAMNLARAVRPYGGRVASVEVDPIHVSIVRNMVEYAGVTDVVDVWTGYCYDVIPHLLEKYGRKSIGMVFMDQRGTRFHTDLRLLEELDLLDEGAVVLADNVLKPGAPLYIWHLEKGPYTNCTAVSVREFLLQSEDWMVMAFHDPTRDPVPTPPPGLHRLAFEADAFRKRSMFDSVTPNKTAWWAFSQRFITGLDLCGCKPRIVGLHGRANPAIQAADIAGIFERAGRA